METITKQNKKVYHKKMNKSNYILHSILFAWMTMALPSFIHAQSFSIKSFETDYLVYKNSLFQITYIPPTGLTVTALDWNFPSSCSNLTVIAPLQLSINVTCRVSSSIPFIIRATPDGLTTRTLEIPVIIQGHHYCFNWYFVTSNDLSTTSSGANEESSSTESNILSIGGTYEGRIWIMDSAKAAEQEKIGTAIKPSDTSKGLSESFYFSGNSPSISILENTAIKFSNPEFDVDSGYWKVTISAKESGLVAFAVLDQDISVFGCTVADGKFHVSVVDKSSLETHGFKKVNSFSPNSQTPYFYIEKEACSSLSTYVRSNLYGDNVFSHSASSTSPLAVTFSYTLSDANDIIDMKTVRDGAVFLANNNRIYSSTALLDLDSVVIEDAAGQNLNRISTSAVCGYSHYVDNSFVNSFVVTWDSRSTTLYSYVSFDYARTFKQIQIEVVSGPATITDVVLDPTSRSLMYSLQKGADTCFVYSLPLGQDVTVLDSSKFTLSTTINGGRDCRFSLAPGGASVLLLYSTTKVFMSQNTGKYFSALNLILLNGITVPELSAAETIEAVRFYDHGAMSGLDKTFIMVTTLGHVFVGKAGFDNLHQIPAHIDTSKSHYIDFDFNGHLKGVYPMADGKFREDISNLDYLISLFAYDTACLYSEWVSNSSTEFILDKNDSITVSLSVSPLEVDLSKNFLSVSFTNASVLDIKKNNAFEDGVQTQDIVIASKKDTGRCDTWMTVVGAGWNCPVVSKSTTLYVGCPPTKRLVFRPPNVKPADNIYKDIESACSNLTISGISIPGEDGETIPYDCKTMGGPPHRAYYSKLFKPQLDVYDGDKFLKTVTGDFVVKEVHAKKEKISYLFKVGCLRPPQIWETFDYDMEQWNAKNYEPCWATDKPQHLDSLNGLDYPIINSTHNSISWYDGMDRYYFLKIKVLDPDFSFCDLSTYVTIEVFGSPMSPGTQIGILLGLTFTLLSALGFTYFYFSSNLTREREEMNLKAKKE